MAKNKTSGSDKTVSACSWYGMSVGQDPWVSYDEELEEEVPFNFKEADIDYMPMLPNRFVPVGAR